MEMRFSNLFIICAAFLIQRITTTSPVNEFELEDATVMASQSNAKGYECGNVFFSDEEVEEVLSRSLMYMEYGLREPEKYIGPLYSDAMSSEYLLWPIKKGHKIVKIIKFRSMAFFIVFRRDVKEVIDVISRTLKNDFTKCIRRGVIQAEPLTSVSERSNGYQCGNEFISDNIIQQSVALARVKLHKGTKFPAPYVGRLYPEGSRYRIWPIFSRKKLYENGNSEAGPFFLVINRYGELIDTIVRGITHNFLRCIRSRISPELITETISVSAEPSWKSGFQCGSVFFDINSLNNVAHEVRSAALLKDKNRYPIGHFGRPFDEPCLLWPILSSGKLYKKGEAGRYRLALTLEYHVLGAVIVRGKEIVACERKTISGKKRHDTSSYYCVKSLIFNDQLVKAAEAGCPKINEDKRTNYPAKYEGPGFDRDGPYLTYPVLLVGEFTHRAGHHRVVMNENCEVVGAITFSTHINKSKRRWLKCHRTEDGQLPPNYFLDQNEPIFEHLSGKPRRFTYKKQL